MENEKEQIPVMSLKEQDYTERYLFCFLFYIIIIIFIHLFVNLKANRSITSLGFALCKIAL